MIEGYEEFSEEQEKILMRYVSNTKSNIFVLSNLPEVIKGALFSRYSRSTLGLRSLLLKDFIKNEDIAFEDIVGQHDNDKGDYLREAQEKAIKKAQNFYDRILDGYGDDSIGELGGAHLAIEQVSMLAAKHIEDCRLGGSPLEKSTRYIYFDLKQNGEYLYYREPMIMASAHKDLYISTCDFLFETYGSLVSQLTEVMEKKYPRDPNVSKIAYTSALRARVLDCIRGVLPAGALTNMGVFGNGRFFETMLQKLSCESLSELQDISQKSFTELSKAIPSFVRRSEPEHRHQRALAEFREKMKEGLEKYAREAPIPHAPTDSPYVRLIDANENAVDKVVAALLFPHHHEGWVEIQEAIKRLTPAEKEAILDEAAKHRTNRRHKPPRALENANFTFEIVADFGVYRDLQRHRILTQERQRLTCNHGYAIPDELVGTEMETEYRGALKRAKAAFEIIAKDFPEEAQYVVPMAYNIRWYFTVNLRALQWLTELRSSPQGHAGYRLVAQEMAFQAYCRYPEFQRFFKYVDFEGHYALGRLDQEIRNAKKAEQAGASPHS